MNTPSKPAATPKAAERTFDFSATFSVPVPEKLPRAQRDTGLPFREEFSKNLAAALEGKQPHWFVPDAFWHSRGADPKKVDKSYGRTKIRDQFNQWVKADEKNRSALDILLIYRTGTEPDFKEPGISFWMVKKT